MITKYDIISLIILMMLIIFYFILKSFSKINVPIYYINIDRSIDRRKYVEWEFNRFNIPITRIKGITPDAISDQDRLVLSQKCSDKTQLEWACMMSHLKAIHTSYTNGDEYSMIIEDDLVIHRMVDFKKLLKTAPEDWEILQMFTFKSEILYPVEDKRLWVEHSDACYSAAAYIINRKGAKKILEDFYPDTYMNKDYNSLHLKTDLTSNCISDITLYKIAKTYICRDLFFLVKAKDSTIIQNNSYVYSQVELVKKIVYFFKTYGYRTTNLTI